MAANLDCLLQGQWLIYGGLWTGEAYSSFYLFDFEKLAWSSPKLSGSDPQARYYHMATCHNQAMVILGGMSQSFCFASSCLLLLPAVLTDWVPVSIKLTRIQHAWRSLLCFCRL